MAQETIRTWIFEEGLRPFLTVLGRLVKYDFNAVDWDAIGPANFNTSEEDDKWYEYVFMGELRANFKIAYEKGSCVYHIILEGPPEIKDRVELAVSMLNEFRLTM